MWAIDNKNDIAAIIDWQTIREGSPISDLARFLILCCDETIRRKAEEFSIDFYIDCLIKEFDGDSSKVPYTSEQIKKSYNYMFLTRVFPMLLPTMSFLNEESMNQKNDKLKNSEIVMLKFFHALKDADLLLQGDMNDWYNQEFNDLLSNLLDKTKATKPPLVKLENDDIRVMFVNQYFVESANMLSNYLPFSELPLIEKVAIHDRIWEQFHALDRCFHIVKNYGNILDDFRMAIDNYQYWDQSFKASLDEKESKHLTILKPLLNKKKILMNEYKKINPTLEEFAYICQIILWSMHVSDLPNISLQTRNIADRIIEKISEELHNYYTTKLRVANYSVRQTKMFQLINLTESFVRDKKQMLIAEEIFGFGGYQFKYCKFELKYYEYLKETDKNK